MANHTESQHHLVEASRWPIVGSFGLFFMVLGMINWMHDNAIIGPILFLIGAVIFTYMLFGWFGDVISDDQAGNLSSAQTLRSFRWGMFWFIFTEVMFFGSFFIAFFYARLFSVPWLGGEGAGQMTHYLLWPAFQAHWPVMQTPDPTQFAGPKDVTYTWGIPALNTLILMVSDLIITYGFWELLRNNRTRLIAAQAVTILLSITFLVLQVYEYGDAYLNDNLTMGSGIYGATFYMLTGVHGSHVLVGVIMLTVMMWRTIKGHFDSTHNFGIAALTWYWHFIDLLWFIMFIFVYWW